MYYVAETRRQVRAMGSLYLVLTVGSGKGTLAEVCRALLAIIGLAPEPAHRPASIHTWQDDCCIGAAPYYNEISLSKRS